jgi:hypothetical protein
MLAHLSRNYQASYLRNPMSLTTSLTLDTSSTCLIARSLFNFTVIQLVMTPSGLSMMGTVALEHLNGAATNDVIILLDFN